MPERRTSESESGFWQTPVSDDAVERKAGEWNSRGEPKLSAQVQLYPTPRAMDGEKGAVSATETTRRRVAEGRANLPEMVQELERFPTPAARDWKSGKGRKDNGHTPQLPERVGGQLNPDWTEWLMGWPIGWTALEPLATDRFQQWCNSHGVNWRPPHDAR